MKLKVTSLKSVVKELKERNLISSACEMVKSTFSGVPLELINRMMQRKTGKGCAYSPELKSFALTL